MSKDNLFFLQHVLDSIFEIEKFMRGINKTKFNANKEKQNAVFRSLEVIGKAVKNISIDITVKYPYIEWSKIAGLRNKLIHHYFGIDLENIWKIIDEDLPKL